MNKNIALNILLYFLLAVIMAFPMAVTASIVPQTCGQSGPITYENGECTSGNTCPCGIKDFFTMLANVYTFIVWDIATPAGIAALIIGGLMMTLGGGNPKFFSMGKGIALSAVIGLVLVFCSYLIVNFVMTSLGYQLNGNSNWSTL